jgi:tetratricopeptide (TPR) repeat protein
MRFIWYWLCILWLMCGAFAFAAQVEELFLKGNAYYHAGNYDNALQCYQEMESPVHAVLYNQGHCYYQLNQPLEALLWWSRAERNASLSELRDIYTNKACAYKKCAAPIPSREQRTVIIPFFCLQSGVLVCWFFLIAFLFFLRGFVRIFFLLVAAGALICLGTLLYKEYCALGMTYGYVGVEQASVYVGPGTWYQRVAALPYASSVAITKQSDGWYAVHTDTLRGWVASDDVRLV